MVLFFLNLAKEEISKIYSNTIEIKKIITEGDINQKDRLSSIGGKGLFSKKIESELLENKMNEAGVEISKNNFNKYGKNN